jgi:hypothetical protein
MRTKSAFDIEKLVLNDMFDKNLDVFSTVVTSEFIISSKLMAAIAEEKLTGVNFVEANGQSEMTITCEG